MIDRSNRIRRSTVPRRRDRVGSMPEHRPERGRAESERRTAVPQAINRSVGATATAVDVRRRAAPGGDYVGAHERLDHPALPTRPVPSGWNTPPATTRPASSGSASAARIRSSVALKSSRSGAIWKWNECCGSTCNRDRYARAAGPAPARRRHLPRSPRRAPAPTPTAPASSPTCRSVVLRCRRSPGSTWAYNHGPPLSVTADPGARTPASPARRPPPGR